MESFRFFRERTLHNLRAQGIEDLNPVHAAMPVMRVPVSSMRRSIAARMGVSKQAAAQLVAKAEALGYVKTDHDPEDSRAKVVRCTAKGKRFLHALDGVVESSVRDVEAVIGTARLHELEEILKLIAAQLHPRRRERAAEGTASPGAWLDDVRG